MSQETRILKMLRKAGSRGVPNYAFPEARILKYSSRITDLRSQGFNVYCERVLLPNGRSTNVYKYFLGEDSDENVTII